MRRLLGLSQKSANDMHQVFGDLAFTVAKLLIMLIDEAKEGFKDPGGLGSNPKESGYTLRHMLADVAGIREAQLDDILKDKNFQKAVNSAKTREEVLQAFEATKSAVRKRKFNPKDVFMQLDGGWFWLNLRNECSDDEAVEMGHCGSDSRGTLYSLRDPNNRPHVTLTYNEKNNTVFQIKGKGNDVPNRKYWGAIIKFFEKTDASLSDRFIAGSELGKHLEAYLYKYSGVREAVVLSTPKGEWISMTKLLGPEFRGMYIFATRPAMMDLMDVENDAYELERIAKKMPITMVIPSADGEHVLFSTKKSYVSDDALKALADHLGAQTADSSSATERISG